MDDLVPELLGGDALSGRAIERHQHNHQRQGEAEEAYGAPHRAGSAHARRRGRYRDRACGGVHPTAAVEHRQSARGAALRGGALRHSGELATVPAAAAALPGALPAGAHQMALKERPPQAPRARLGAVSDTEAT